MSMMEPEPPPSPISIDFEGISIHVRYALAEGGRFCATLSAGTEDRAVVDAETLAQLETLLEAALPAFAAAVHLRLLTSLLVAREQRSP